ncbi:MAG: ABC transporter permease subunit [Oscillospiraceae bacterium]|nr:ABC transporter permease subunit [Oscillospiraceae bacterium]
MQTETKTRVPEMHIGGRLTRHRSRAFSSRAGTAYCVVALLMVVSVCLFIIVNVVSEGAGVVSMDFLLSPPNASAMNAEAGGIITPLFGTVALTALGTLVAFPFSLATAIFLCFYTKKNWFTSAIRYSIDILSGVPTVVIGLFSLAIFTNPALVFLSTPVENMDGVVVKAFGRSFLVASIAMAIMVLPFIIKSMEEALRSVPIPYIEGSYALGASKWRTINKIAIKSSIPGLVTGVVLGMGRIVGDTAIVWLALGGSIRMPGPRPWYWPPNWLATLRNSGATLTSYIYYTSPAGEGNNFTVAFGASLVLMALIIVLNAVTALIGYLAGRNTREEV